MSADAGGAFWFVTSVSFSRDVYIASGSATIRCLGCDWGVSADAGGAFSLCASVVFPDGTKVASGSHDKTIKIWEDLRHREMKVTMLCLRRANRRRRDRSGNPLPSEAGRKLYNPDIMRHIAEFL